MKTSKTNYNSPQYYEGSNHNINHLFLKKDKGNYLIVILCDNRLENILKNKNIMDYLNSLENNILLVDDYIDDILTFYIGIGGKETVSEDVVSLINTVLKDIGYDVQRLIICGYGRAGTSSLILGEKLKTKYIFSSFPKLYFSSSVQYLEQNKKNEVLDYIVGNPGNYSEDILNELLHKKVLRDKRYQSKIFLQGIATDESLSEVIQHFDNIKQRYNLDIQQEYENSEELFLKSFLQEKIQVVIKNMIIEKPEIDILDNKSFLLNLKLKNFDIETMDVAVYFYSKTKWIKAINYNKELEYKIDLNFEIIDSIKIFVKKGKRVLDIKRCFVQKDPS